MSVWEPDHSRRDLLPRNDPERTAVVTTLLPGGHEVAVDVSGTTLAVAAMEAGFALYDVTNPTAPVLR